MCLTTKTAAIRSNATFVTMSDSFRNRLRRECPEQCPELYFEGLVPSVKEAGDPPYHKVKWNEPNPIDEEDHRIVQEIVEDADEKPEQEVTHTDSEDDRPLEEVGLPSASSIQLPKWKHGLTPHRENESVDSSGRAER